MSSPASVAKHPIHPMLVAFPIGLLMFSVVCNLVYILGPHGPIWAQVALYTMGGGIVGGLLAAVPGVIDYISITDKTTRNIAWKHMLVNVTGLVLFIVAFWTEYQTSNANLALTFSVLGTLSLGVGGWLGGELVYVKGMAVDRVDQLERQRDTTRETIRRAS